MIDLTPLDVRNKRGDFRKGMRGYEPREVDAFLEVVAERMEVLVRESLTMRDRLEELSARVEKQEARENAVQEALVSAQALREEIREQTAREAELRLREADQEAERRRAEAAKAADRARAELERLVADRRRDLEELARSRALFLRGYRTLLEKELDLVTLEEGRPAEVEVDLDALEVFQGGSHAESS